MKVLSFYVIVLLSNAAVFAAPAPAVSNELFNPAHPTSSNFPHSAVPAPQKVIMPSGPPRPSTAPKPAASSAPKPVKSPPAAEPIPSKPASEQLTPISPISPVPTPSDALPSPSDASAPGIADAPATTPEAGPTATSDGSVCFPADATVRLESGAVINMENLQVGHRVQVGINAYSDVVMFTHALRDTKHSFVQLTTDSGKTMRATEGHYIYADGKLARMGDVVLGNVLETSSGTTEKVVRILLQQARGLYNPQTAHGDIVVDGIRASTYTETIPNKAAHAMLAPVRAAFEWTGLRINVLEKIVW